MNFLKKYELLKKSVPVAAVSIGPHTIDSNYVDYAYSCKNCFFCFNCDEIEDSLYTIVAWKGKKLVDCDAVTESEKCYKCISCNKCYGGTYLIDCNNSTDCHFSAFLNSCSDCFGCVSLSHKKYCIFNKQYSKEGYFKKVEELKKEKPEALLEKMFELKEKIPHPASQQFSSENCPYGEYINNSKNCYWSFNSYYCENSGYNFITALAKNCWDTFFSGGNQKLTVFSEKCYELVDSIGCYNSAFLSNCDYSTNCFFGTKLVKCSDCFGCVGLKNKKYCVLNNQLTKEQYVKAVKDIKKELGWKI